MKLNLCSPKSRDCGFLSADRSLLPGLRWELACLMPDIPLLKVMPRAWYQTSVTRSSVFVASVLSIADRRVFHHMHYLHNFCNM